MKPPEEVKTEFVRQWLRKADEDLLVCRRLASEPGVLGVASFHAQQAVEKALKAFLVLHQVEFSKSHDIGRILELIALIDAELAARLKTAESLNVYAVQHRYPTDLPEPTVEDVEAAVSTAERVFDEVLARLPREFRDVLNRK